MIKQYTPLINNDTGEKEYNPNPLWKTRAEIESEKKKKDEEKLK